MNICIIAVGKCRDSSILDLISKYSKRFNWSVSIKEIDTGKASSISKQEDNILKNIPKGNQVIVALDERGKSFSSPDFSGQFEKWQLSGVSKVSFLIGGADGFSDDLRKKADFLLSFGKQTWPHMLVRVMLVEQIYRAQQILAGHPYHHS